MVSKTDGKEDLSIRGEKIAIGDVCCEIFKQVIREEAKSERRHVLNGKTMFSSELVQV